MAGDLGREPAGNLCREPWSVRSFHTSSRARGARRAASGAGSIAGYRVPGRRSDRRFARRGGRKRPQDTRSSRAGSSALAPAAHGGLPPERCPALPVPGRPPLRPPSAPAWGRPSSWRSSLEPSKIAVKGGAYSAVTRDALRAPFTAIVLGSLGRLSGGWPGARTATVMQQDGAMAHVTPGSGTCLLRPPLTVKGEAAIRLALRLVRLVRARALGQRAQAERDR